MKKKTVVLIVSIMSFTLLFGCDKNITIEETSSVKDSMELYIGEYNDYDNNEPNLEIAKGENGQYIVQIGIFRLTALEDGVGIMTNDGLEFTATDASGSPIGGVISLNGDIATVTFTDSTWDYIKNGDQYCYTKSSDTPNLWENN